MFLTVPVNDVTAATVAALGVCLALFHRSRRGVGQHVWTSLAAVSALLQTPDLVRFPARPAPRPGGRDHRGPDPAGTNQGHSGGPDGFHRTRDGWVRIEAPDVSVATVASTLGMPGATVAAALSGLVSTEAVSRLRRAGVPAVAVPTTRQLAEDQALARFGFLGRDPRPGRQTWWTTARLARFSRTEGRDILVAPVLGQHTRETLEEAGLSRAEIAALVETGAAVEPPPA